MNSIRQRVENKKNSILDKARLTLNSNKSKGKMLIAVEGPDDKDFYDPFFDSSGSLLFVTEGCENLSRVLSEYNPKYHDRIIAIKDADFDHLNGTKKAFDNLFVTDFHDYEMFIINHDSIKEIAADFNIPDPENERLHMRTLMKIENYSYLKWLNSKRLPDDKGVNFKDSKVDKHLGKSIEECVDILNLVPANADSQIDTAIALQFKKNNPAPYWKQLYNGHDYCLALSCLIRKIKPQNIKKNSIPKKLRKFYSLSDFSMTLLYRDIFEYLLKSNIFNPNNVLKALA